MASILAEAQAAVVQIRWRRVEIDNLEAGGIFSYLGRDAATQPLPAHQVMSSAADANSSGSGAFDDIFALNSLAPHCILLLFSHKLTITIVNDSPCVLQAIFVYTRYVYVCSVCAGGLPQYGFEQCST